ncbi:TrbG/VirB9 family P-type conjugative transfer protein [Vibrio algicola]|uniref:TrbG/VirB9 family P-type conjugative transfer protein n=1 Tax=Vibrio algicola TaxID=2662262 RepID=UPI0015B3EB6B|nr:TrbG/VirB9 family P-type conjugative transfer protein [Vibrio algicola]
MKTTTLALLTILVCSPFAHAQKRCTPLYYKSGQVITVHSALNLGTRIQLPANLITPPLVSNANLWDVEGIQGTNQIVVKPNSNESSGAQTMIYAYTDNGLAFDINMVRTTSTKNEACAIINISHQQASKHQTQDLQSFIAASYQSSNNTEAQVLALRHQLQQERIGNKKKVTDGVMAALRKYRYHIYTRYKYDEGAEFVGNNTISDVYDDGRFTYIRLANPNRGVLSVETMIGGKNAIAPVKYDDAYGMYRITGIYPKFTLRIDDVKIIVTRSDNSSHGAS